MEVVKKTKIGLRIFVVGVFILLATWLLAVSIFLEIFDESYLVSYLSLLVLLSLVVGMATLVAGGGLADYRIYQLPKKGKYLLLTLPSIVWGSMGGILYILRNDPYLLGMSVVFLFLFTVFAAKVFFEEKDADTTKIK